MRCQLQPQALCVGFQRVFAHRVRPHQGRRNAAALRTDAHHAAAALQQQRHQGARQAVRAEDIGVEERVQVFVRPAQQQANATDAGVVHHRVQTVTGLHDAIGRLLRLRRIAHVQRQRHRAQVLQHLPVAGLARAGIDAVAGLQQGLHDGQADAAAGTSDQHRGRFGVVHQGRCRGTTRASSGSGSKPTTMRQPCP